MTANPTSSESRESYDHLEQQHRDVEKLFEALEAAEEQDKQTESERNT